MGHSLGQHETMNYPLSTDASFGGHEYHPALDPSHHHPAPYAPHPTEYMSPMSPQSAIHVNPYGMPYPGYDASGYCSQHPSFDSNGSPSSAPMPMQPPHPPLPHRYMPPYPHFFPPWPVVAPPTLIIDITPSDVLCGRGGATNSHSGNKKFRAFVKDHQEKYLKAKKKDKPAVASIIVDLIREKGGRFLRRYDTDVTGQVRWIDIGDDRAREKTCQALRENAPELRRRRLGTSSSEEDGKPLKSDSPDPSHCSSAKSSSLPTTEIALVHPTVKATETPTFKTDDGPIMIRPDARLLPGQVPVDPIPLESLSPEDRSFYLQDFLPPCPPLRAKLDTTVEHVGASATGVSTPWSAMSV